MWLHRPPSGYTGRCGVIQAAVWLHRPPSGWPQQQQEQQQQQQDVNWPHNSLSCRIESLISRSLARSHSQRTHTRFTPKSLKKHWFYKVVRDKGCFYIGFTRLSAKKVVFTLILQGLSAKNGVLHWFYKENSRTTRGQPGHGFGRSSSSRSSSSSRT